jgi:predicted ATPase with chaperone activity
MLARRLVPILPAMSLAEALETTRIHRVADFTGGRAALVMAPSLPRCSPSHRDNHET